MLKDITGITKGRLTALRYTGRKTKHGNAIWTFRCACDGREIEVTSGHFVSGIATSCGCVRREMTAAKYAGRHGKAHPSFKHGHGAPGKQSPTWRSWTAMTQRVTNPTRTSHEHYFDAGIKSDPRWLDKEHGFQNFLADMGERPSQQHSLGRFGDIGNYEKSNCAWQTSKEQHAEQKTKRALAFLAA